MYYPVNAACLSDSMQNGEQTMEVTAYTINAFARTEEGGNPAGVVLHADQLSEQQMKQIAKAVGFSETAFLMQSASADCRVRFFTPADEVDLCGHATIGTFSLLRQKGMLKRGCYRAETRAGIIDIEISEDAEVMMSQLKPQFHECVSREAIADSLCISADEMDSRMEPQIVSTGLRDIMVPIRSRKLLDEIHPDFDKVAALSRQYQVIGYHLFTQETLYHDTAYCRNLAPLYGIPEEAATGTSSGALACYLVHCGQVHAEEAEHLVFEQGYCMGRPSEIQVSLLVQDNRIEAVHAGGTAGNINIRRILMED